MKIALPVSEYLGLESSVHGHFGSALVFALVDSETMAIEPIGNRDHDHVHGACRPMKAFAGGQRRSCSLMVVINPPDRSRETRGIDGFSHQLPAARSDEPHERWYR